MRKIGCGATLAQSLLGNAIALWYVRTVPVISKRAARITKNLERFFWAGTVDDVKLAAKLARSCVTRSILSEPWRMALRL
jgi:hypothetical protein